MTAIWRHDGTGWRLTAPAAFPDEATLHDLVAGTPHLLPLAGSPRLTVIGREVRLGANYADLLAIEPSGRLTIVEVKLAHNAEARRAVIAQILTYAAFLHGLDPATLERDILRAHLHKRGHESLAAAAAADDQTGSFDAASFRDGLAESLAGGSFRLVLVLDDAPEELVRLAGYLGTVAEKLLIDLVAISAYQIDGSQILVPQRIDPERQPNQPDRPYAEPGDRRHWPVGSRRRRLQGHDQASTGRSAAIARTPRGLGSIVGARGAGHPRHLPRHVRALDAPSAAPGRTASGW